MLFIICRFENYRRRYYTGCIQAWSDKLEDAARFTKDDAHLMARFLPKPTPFEGVGMAFVEHYEHILNYEHARKLGKNAIPFDLRDGINSLNFQI